ncbi:hypothetical protein HAX54_031657, partial [Datura stramonium]|nr:hypothetical protein [Datura stramonium]
PIGHATTMLDTSLRPQSTRTQYGPHGLYTWNSMCPSRPLLIELNMALTSSIGGAIADLNSFVDAANMALTVSI